VEDERSEDSTLAGGGSEGMTLLSYGTNYLNGARRVNIKISLLSSGGEKWKGE
jgi:hypothetical protein